MHQIVVATIVGVIAGTYIWRPVLQQYVADHPEVARTVNVSSGDSESNSNSKGNNAEPDTDIKT